MASEQTKKRLWALAVLFVVVAAATLGAAILFSANNGHGAGPGLRVQPSSTDADDKAVPPSAVPQPPTAEQVAAQLSCTGFTSRNAGGIGGTVTAGNCWKNGKKYAINTFMTTAARDSWLSLTERMGVVPTWETPTSVVYPSVLSQ